MRRRTSGRPGGPTAPGAGRPGRAAGGLPAANTPARARTDVGWRHAGQMEEPCRRTAVPAASSCRRASAAASRPAASAVLRRLSCQACREQKHVVVTGPKGGSRHARRRASAQTRAEITLARWPLPGRAHRVAAVLFGSRRATATLGRALFRRAPPGTFRSPPSRSGTESRDALDHGVPGAPIQPGDGIDGMLGEPGRLRLCL